MTITKNTRQFLKKEPGVRRVLRFRLLISGRLHDPHDRPFARRRSVGQVLSVPLGAGKDHVHPDTDCLSCGRRQVERPLHGLHHERTALTLAAVRVVHVHLLDVLPYIIHR